MEAQGSAPTSSQGGLWLGGDPAESPAVATARLKKLEVQMGTTLKLLEENHSQLERLLTSVDRLADKQDEFQSKFDNLRPARQKSKMKSKVKLTRAFESPSSGDGPGESVEASSDNKEIIQSPEAVAASKFKLPPLTPAATPGGAEGNAPAPAAASAPSAVSGDEENSGDSDSDEEPMSRSTHLERHSTSKWDRYAESVADRTRKRALGTEIDPELKALAEHTARVKNDAKALARMKASRRGTAAPAKLLSQQASLFVKKVNLAHELHGVIPHVRASHHKLMLPPHSQYRLLWDMGVVAPLMVYLTVLMPFRICFSNDPVPGTSIFWFEVVIELIFIADIVFNFRTGYVVHGLTREVGVNSKLSQIEYDPWLCAKNYALTWLPLDLVSGIPFHIINYLFEGDSAPVLKVVKSLRLLRILKLTRLFKLEHMFGSIDRTYLDRIEDFLAAPQTKNAVTLFSLVLQTAFVVHLACCIWVQVARWAAQRGDDNWLAHEIEGFVARDTEGGPHVATIYIAAYYFCISTVTTVGYGDIITHNNDERLFAIGLEFIGTFVFAIIISTLTSVVANFDIDKRKVAEQLDAVSSFIIKRKFPTHLSRRVRRHFRQFYEQQSTVDERKIFREMSAGLRLEVSSYIVTVQMGGVKVFQTMNPLLWSSLIALLKPLRFDPGEVVCRQGDECTEMYMVHQGRLTGFTKVNTGLALRERTIEAGDSFNILCLLKVWNQCVETVICPKNGAVTEAYAVAAHEFSKLFNMESPIDRRTFAEMQRVACLNFKMDKEHPDAPTPLGFPLYMTFASVSICICSARDLIGHDWPAVSDPYAVIELVYMTTQEPVGPSFRFRTSTQTRTTSPVWADEEGIVKWRNIQLPFEALSVRVRLYDEDLFSDDDPLGEVALPLLQLEEKTTSRTGKPFRGKTKLRMMMKMGSFRNNVQVEPDSEAVGDGGGSGDGLGGGMGTGLDAAEDEEVGAEVAADTRASTMSRFKQGVMRAIHKRTPEESELEEGWLETWYDLAPAPGMSTVKGSVRLRTWAKRSDA